MGALSSSSSFIAFFFFILFLARVRGQTVSNPDMEALLTGKVKLGSSDNILLSTWNLTSDPCSWRGVQWVVGDSTINCSLDSDSSLAQNQSASVRVYSIGLPAAGLNGSIPSEFGELSQLQSLILTYNSLSGPIPSELGNSASLSVLYLSHNQIDGSIPVSLWNLCSGGLTELHLDYNNISGSLPTPAAPNTSCPLLRTMNLTSNLLSGSIPSFLGNFSGLMELDLSQNDLSGSIPDTIALLPNLTVLNLSGNNLTGSIPAFSSTSFELTTESFSDNPLLCGPPLSNSCDSGGGRALSPKAVAAIVICLLSVAVVGLALFVALGHKHNWGRTDATAAALLRKELEEEDVGEGKLVRFEGGEHLTVEEVLNAPGEVLGKTNYGTVYKARLRNGGFIALRLLRQDTVTEREVFASIIQELGFIRHPNLVSVLAYYAGSKGEKLLACSYLSHGSLSDLLHDKTHVRPALSWARRHKIILGAARGLAYLHHKHLLHGNIKSTNILVDENYEGHLADYGLDKLLNLSAQNDMITAASAQGYNAPELKKMSRASMKSDIYSFGTVLLETLMGKKPRESGGLEEKEKEADVDLPSMVKTAVLEERVAEVFDLELIAGGTRSAVEEGLLRTLKLAMGCCAPSPSSRPDMKEIVRQLEEIRPKIPTPLYTPTGMKSPREYVPY